MNKRLVAYLALAFIGGVMTCYGLYVHKHELHHIHNKILKRGIIHRELKSDYKFINPLLECEVADEVDFTELASFKVEIEEKIIDFQRKNKNLFVSVYFRDLNNGPWIGINEKEEFSPSSLLKVPLMMSVYQQSEDDPEILNKKVVYDGSFDKNERRNLEKDSPVLEKDKEYTISELVEYMIKYSDNNATELIAQTIGNKYFFSPYIDLNLPLPLIQSNDYVIRVKDYASFFRVLFNASYLDRKNAEKALEILSKTDFKKGIVAGVPEDIVVAHKYGERIWKETQEHQVHDCGIVYYPNHPYLLCVMTKGGHDLEYLEGVISTISKVIYEEVSVQLRAKSMRSFR